jgi:HEPN domain-containing protein
LHCQQAAEKYLKALLQEFGLVVPRIHELLLLLQRLIAHDGALAARFASLKRGLDKLTPYAVEFRYPGFHADARKAKAAIHLADRVRLEIRKRLGLRTSP